MSIANLTRTKDFDTIFSVVGIIEECTSSLFTNQMELKISQGEREVLYFKMMIGKNIQ